MVRHEFLVLITVGSNPTTLDVKFAPDEIPGWVQEENKDG